MTRKELTLAEFSESAPERLIAYGVGNGSVDAEALPLSGTSMYHANTNGGDYDDEDDSCYEAEKSWNTGTVDSQDWSNPGKQSGSTY